MKVGISLLQIEPQAKRKNVIDLSKRAAKKAVDIWIDKKRCESGIQPIIFFHSRKIRLP